jgi:hypothetical protein
MNRIGGKSERSRFAADFRVAGRKSRPMRRIELSRVIISGGTHRLRAQRAASAKVASGLY